VFVAFWTVAVKFVDALRLTLAVLGEMLTVIGAVLAVSAFATNVTTHRIDKKRSRALQIFITAFTLSLL
jgi:hypothetical protein